MTALSSHVAHPKADVPTTSMVMYPASIDSKERKLPCERRVSPRHASKKVTAHEVEGNVSVCHVQH